MDRSRKWIPKTADWESGKSVIMLTSKGSAFCSLQVPNVCFYLFSAASSCAWLPSYNLSRSQLDPLSSMEITVSCQLMTRTKLTYICLPAVRQNFTSSCLLAVTPTPLPVLSSSHCGERGKSALCAFPNPPPQTCGWNVMILQTWSKKSNPGRKTAQNLLCKLADYWKHLW